MVTGKDNGIGTGELDEGTTKDKGEMKESEDKNENHPNGNDVALQGGR